MGLQFMLKSAVARTRAGFGKNTPLRVLHRITTRCNLRCTFCDHKLHEDSREEISTAEIKSAMNQFRELGCLAWGITGGEPFLRKDLPEIIHHSKSLGFLTSCITNSTVASPETITDLSGPLDYLVTSLEGPPEVTDSIRGKGVFSKVVRTIEAARMNDLPVIVGTVITRRFLEAGGIEFMGRFCKEMDVRCSFQNLLLTGPYGGHGFKQVKSDIEPHNPEREMLYDALDRILEMRKQGYPFVNNKPWADYVKAYYDGTLKAPPCYAGKLYCNFFEDGSLRTCQYHPLKVKKPTIAEAFASLPGEFKECPCVAICYINYNLAFSFNIPMILDGFKNAFAS